MKILFLGAADHTKLRIMANYFYKSGWQVSVVTFIDEPIPNINYHYLKVKRLKRARENFFYLFKIPTVRKIIERENPDIIDCHFLTSYGLIGFLANRKRKYIINLYGTDIYKNSISNALFNFLSRMILNSATHVFTLSETMRKFTIEHFPQIENKITNIQYGTNSDIFTIIEKFSKRKYDFVTNRLFVENSNYIHILGAFKKSVDINPDLKLLIFGKGPLKEFIESFIKNNDLTNNITLIDYISHERLPLLLNSARYYISLTNSDGTPNSLFEAIFCGLYPILSAINQNFEWRNKGIEATFIKNSTKIEDELSERMLFHAKNYPSEEVIVKNREISLSFMDFKKNMKIIENKTKTIANS